MLVAHYLIIDWLSPGIAREIEVSDAPVEIERNAEDCLSLELEIFPEDHCWLGLRCEGDAETSIPQLVVPGSDAQPLMEVRDSRGGIWYIPEHGWDPVGKRHLNAFYRSLGQFTIVLGKTTLTVTTIEHSGRRTMLEDYLRDFTSELIWLVLGFDGSGNGQGARADLPLARASRPSSPPFPASRAIRPPRSRTGRPRSG